MGHTAWLTPTVYATGAAVDAKSSKFVRNLIGRYGFAIGDSGLSKIDKKTSRISPRGIVLVGDAVKSDFYNRLKVLRIPACLHNTFVLLNRNNAKATTTNIRESFPIVENDYGNKLFLIGIWFRHGFPFLMEDLGGA